MSWIESFERSARTLWCAGAIGIIALCASATADTGTYPLALTLDAHATTGVTTVNSVVTIHVDRLMEENRFKRVSDALKQGGYGNFMNALRPLPPVGKIELAKRSVDVRYAREQPDGSGRRLVLAADRPLFFLGDAEKSRAGYELTLVELRFDADGNVTGRMAGAARVKPGPDGGVVLDDFAEAPVQLTGRPARP